MIVLIRPSLVNAIQQLLGKLGYSDNQLVPAHFRNFETASDLDFLSLLHELEGTSDSRPRRCKGMTMSHAELSADRLIDDLGIADRSDLLLLDEIAWMRGSTCQ